MRAEAAQKIVVEKPTAKEDRGFAPRLKPVVKTEKLANVVSNGRAARLGEPLLASDDVAPPPFFFASDIERKGRPLVAAATLYAGDIDQQTDEVRIRIVRGENFVDALARAGIGAQERKRGGLRFWAAL